MQINILVVREIFDILSPYYFQTEDNMKPITLTRMAMLTLVLVGMATMGFQCSSPNITSGKLYLQQYQSSKNKEKLDKAEEAFQKEVTQKPNSSEGWYWLGHVYAEKKEYRQLQESWAKAEKLGGKSTAEIDQYRVLYWGQSFNYGANTLKKAQIAKNAKLYEQAAEAFEAATLLQADSSAKYNAYVYLAFSLMGMEKFDEAKAPLQKQIDTNPSPEAYSALGQLMGIEANTLKKDGKEEAAAAKYDETLTLLNRAITDFPNNADLNNELLNTYIAADRVTEAVDKFSSYADNNPKDASAQYAAGTAMLQVKKYEEATGFLARAVALEPQNASALYNLCVGYLRWGIGIRDADDSTDPDATQKDYKTIIEKSLPHMKSLLDIQPDNASNWDLAGKIYATIGMTKEAQEAYEKADELRK